MKGLFRPHHPERYKGNPTNIVWRSSWELKFFMQLDHNENVEWWSSEETVVPYQSPWDRRAHRYFPDVLVKYKNNGQIIMYEIKPAKETVPPVPSKSKRRFIKECAIFATNQAKWQAAERYCAQRGWQFKTLTERELGIPNGTKKI